MAIIFQNPKVSVVGEDALRKSSKYIVDYGKKAFIVTGKHVVKTQVMTELKSVLERCQIDYFIFDGVVGEPTDEVIAKGKKLYENSHCDFIIGIGGGSPIDSAKAIAIPNGHPLSFYMNKEITGDIPKIVAIPTTAGTGSEATRFTVITDVETTTKMLLKGDKLIPDLAVVDPKYCLSAPLDVTVNTALDALTHAIESYLSVKANEITEMFSLKAIEWIFEYLPKVLEDEGNVDYRYYLSLASYHAGTAINNASVTLVHGMSRPLGAMYHIPHGLSNALLLEDCLDYLSKELKSEFKVLAKTVGGSDFMSELHRLIELCDLPSIRDLGIDKDDFLTKLDKMASDAMASGSPGNSKADIKKETLINIYREFLKKH